MSAVTFGGAGTPAAAAGESTSFGSRRSSFFARFFEALKETRRREARRVIETYTHLLPPGDS